MKIRKILYTSHFRRALQRIPRELVRLIREREKLFKEACFDPQLRTHKLKGTLRGFWSFSLTYSHRVLFKFEEGGTVIFIDVGDHLVYK